MRGSIRCVSIALGVTILTGQMACSPDSVTAPNAEVAKPPIALSPPQTVNFVTGTVQGYYYGDSWQGLTSLTYSAPAPSDRTIQYYSASSCNSCQYGVSLSVFLEVYNNGDGVLTDSFSYAYGQPYAYVYANFPASGPAVYRYARGSHTINNSHGSTTMYSYVWDTI
jgi:hypothetical protein